MQTPQSGTLLERMGGEPVVEQVVRDFVGRMFGDFIIGFLFEGRDRERIIRHEIEHAVRVLGGDVPYTGRPLASTHRPLRINAGQFRRRLALLRTVLTEHGVHQDVITAWIEHDRRLERAITDGTDCVDHGSSPS